MNKKDIMMISLQSLFLAFVFLFFFKSFVLFILPIVSFIYALMRGEKNV